MRELIGKQNRCAIRWQLRSNASALALLAATCSAFEAKASDDNGGRPTVWIELGGQLVHANEQESSFPVGFLATNPDSPVLRPTTPLQAQRPVPFEFAEEGKVLLQPEGSDWDFAIAGNYGRQSNLKHINHQTNRVFEEVGTSSTIITTAANFADTQAHHKESHVVLDFLVGKDVGLGMLGRNSSSILSAGVRFAQFSSDLTLEARARPDLRVSYKYIGAIETPHLYFHTYHVAGQASRSFHGIGPTLSWSDSTSFVGDPRNGDISFDWGVNGALLFGRQKARVRHQESGHYANEKYLRGPQPYTAVYQHSGGHDTSRAVVIPNVGGFASATYRIEDFKVSIGYRADFFFGAIDDGIDVRKSKTVGFYGPFASISVGLGG